MKGAIEIKINKYQFIEGAKRARGVAVIIDVFRAFSLECYLARNNAGCIIPVADKDLAYKLKAQNPDYILLGERNGYMLPGFDYGNSPAQIENVDFSGKTIIHTTSSGTQGLENALNADVVLTGALVNSRAIARYILRNGFDEVSLVAMGTLGASEAPEDMLCALYIESLLKGNEADISDEIERLKTTSGKRFFINEGADFPERDFELCTTPNIFDFVLKIERVDNSLRSIKIEQADE